MRFPGPAPTRGLLASALVCALEGVAFTGYALFVIIEVARVGITGPEPVSNSTSVSLEIVLFLFFGLGLLWVAWGMWRARRWSRAPAVLAQLIALVVGVPLVGAQGWSERIAGALITTLAAVAIVGIFLPSSTRALVGPEES